MLLITITLALLSLIELVFSHSLLIPLIGIVARIIYSLRRVGVLITASVYYGVEIAGLFCFLLRIIFWQSSISQAVAVLLPTLICMFIVWFDSTNYLYIMEEDNNNVTDKD